MDLIGKGLLRKNDKRILIIDDEYFNCDAMESMIKIYNPELVGKIDKALSGEEALAYILKFIQVHPQPLIDKSLEKKSVSDNDIERFV